LLVPKSFPAICPDFAQKWVMLVIILLDVLFAVVFNRKPQRAQLLPGGTILNLTGNGILPLSQLAITDELSALIAAMDKDDVFPAFDTQNLVFGNFQYLCNRAYTYAEFLGRLEAAK
jgi:hypothetical protein